jgi:uncharacterized membrane protein
MITYTTLMGFAAGISMILVTVLGYKLFYKQAKVDTFDGWALSFAGLGGILTVLGAHMSIIWPLQAPERFKNFMFGEPVLVLGVLLLLAAFFLWRRSDMLITLLHGTKSQQKDARNHLFAVIQPVSWIIFGLGLVLGACTIAAFQYEVFATAPAQEPILGTLPKALTNTALSMLYALPALGCLLVPVAFYLRSRKVMLASGLLILLTGIGWLAVATLVYYTHIAMDFNFRM